MADVNPFDGLRFRIDPEDLDDAVAQLRSRVVGLCARVEDGWDHARATRVRVSYKGVPLGRDLPLALFLAGQGAAVVTVGPLLTFVGNLAGKAMLDVELLRVDG